MLHTKAIKLFTEIVLQIFGAHNDYKPYNLKTVNLYKVEKSFVYLSTFL